MIKIVQVELNPDFARSTMAGLGKSQQPFCYSARQRSSYSLSDTKAETKQVLTYHLPSYNVSYVP
jgi:hypothetical protein